LFWALEKVEARQEELEIKVKVSHSENWRGSKKLHLEKGHEIEETEIKCASN
jgi:hypothetical protein